MRRGPFRFRRLQTRLTALYTSLFAGVLLVLAMALNIVVTANVRGELARELASASATFERIRTLQTDRLSQGGALLAQDFGFRQAVATGDGSTTASALANLSARLKVDAAFLMRPDGGAVGGEAPTGLDTRRLVPQLDPYVVTSGVVVVGGRPFMAVAAPVLAPDPQGWIVFLLQLGRPELQALEKTASIPLHAEIYAAATGGMPEGVRRVLAVAAQGRVSDPETVGDRLVLAQPMPRLDGERPAALVLSYPLKVAAAPYRRIVDLVAVAAVLGALALAGGSWLVARDVTRPVRVLDDAARALGRGELVDVAVEGRDELARLSQSFKGMAVALRDREARITAFAEENPETGLPNRRALLREVEALLARGAADVGVAELRIDRFAHIRNAIGHPLSLDLMREAAARLDALGLGPVAQLTSGSLGFALARATRGDMLIALDAAAAAWRDPVRVAQAAIDVTATLGFALAPEDGATPELLLERASIAVEQAAADGARRSRFDAALYGDPSRNLSLMGELLDAIRGGDLTLAYQPKYDLRRRRISGVEALARWTHPVRGAIGPDLFVGMAEETGHIREMTDWVLDRALADRAVLVARGFPLEMSVNISGRLIGDEGFVADAIARAANRTEGLCFEITETAIIADPVACTRNLHLLSEAGVRISIDDYGSGLSSLTYLRQIPAQELKIDKSFVSSMDEDARSALLVRSTIDMAHALGLSVTAEGVETPAAQALLAAMGCDVAQGYLISRPLPFARLCDFLDGQSADAAVA